MAKGKAGIDKNLTNVVSDLERDPVNSHEAQQIQQAVNDRRHQDALNRHKNKDMDPAH